MIITSENTLSFYGKFTTQTSANFAMTNEVQMSQVKLENQIIVFCKQIIQTGFVNKMLQIMKDPTQEKQLCTQYINSYEYAKKSY